MLPVHGGVGCLDPRVPASWEHNSLWITGEHDAAGIAAEADRVLAGCAHRRAVTDRRPPAALGWEIEELRVQVWTRPHPTHRRRTGGVHAVTQEVMAGLWVPSWRRDHPEIDDAAIDDLVRRESFANAHVRIVDLAVLDDDGVPVAGTQLRVDGATAAVETVMTAPDGAGRVTAARSSVTRSAGRAPRAAT